jgi:hypothetical protein
MLFARHTVEKQEDKFTHVIKKTGHEDSNPTQKL